MALTGQELLDYACTQFENRAYDAALEAFILAYTKGYEREWVLDNINNCYMAGNEAEFQKNYEFWNTGKKPVYENLTLDFVPYHEGEYYIYDKEIQNFRGIFSMDSVSHVTRQEDFRQMEFSALAVAMYWDWSDLPEILAEAGYHKVYVVCQDMDRCASFFKIPELEEYAKNIMLFSDMEEFQRYFHEHTSVYLPKMCTGIEDGKKKLLEIINREHEYRLTPEGRNTKNVLLTIGIPTANRGHLVLRRLENLLKMPFDAEIEIAISKNCTESYEEEYRKIPQIPDARIQYFDHGKALNPTDNWIYTVEMAHGKYVLLVSDEDDVIIEALEHYLAILSNMPELSVIRACTSFQNIIHEREYKKKGLEAFGRMFLAQNYLSGLIVRRKDFVAGNFRELHTFSHNAFYLSYPHEWWCAFLSRQGDYLREPIRLISENESMIAEEMSRLREQGMLDEKQGMLDEKHGIVLPPYSTYEARLKQFLGHIEFIHFFMKDDQVGIELALGLAISKTAYLFELALSYRYKLESFLQMLDEFTQCSMNGIDDFDLSEEQKLRLLNLIGREVVRLMRLYESFSTTETRE